MQTLITAKRLQRWAEEDRDARTILPALIRRLAHATCESIERIDFPAYESVQRPGFDGEIKFLHENPWVPEGHSVWELSVDKKVATKAKADFQKRTDDTPEELRKNATYVVLTARHWRNKKELEREANQLGNWKSVRAYDCDDLEQWIEAAPAVALWLADRWGMPVHDLSHIESRWKAISNSTVPSLNPEVFLVSRERSRATLLNWLSDNSGCLTIVSPFPSEGVDFACAVVASLDDNAGESVGSRMLIARTGKAVREISRQENSSIVLVEPQAGFTIEDISAAEQCGMRLILAREPFDPLPMSSLRLERVREHELARALQECGLSQVVSEQKAKDAGGSLALLKESLARTGRPARSEQIEESARGSLRACLLLGGWDSNNPADRAAVEQVAGKAYSDVEVDCNLLAARRNPLLLHADNKWRVISKGDAWATLNNYVSEEHLKAFEPLAVSILCDRDPAFELPEQERWLARIKGFSPKYSGVIKKQLADTLALLGAFGENVSPAGRLPVIGFADRIVRQVLTPEASWELWASLGSKLSLLAEASPNAFLAAVEADLSASEANSSFLFKETKGHPLTSGCHYSGLLWSLETLAWAPEHLPRVSMALFKLHRFYVPGNYSNSPMASLNMILSCALPYTTGTVDLRIGILRQLHEHDAQTAWELQIALLSQFRGGMFPQTSRPAWRDWAANWEQGVTYADMGKQLDYLCLSLLEHVGKNLERWSELIDLLTSMPEQPMLQAIEQLETLSKEEIEDQQRSAFREKLLDYISLHRSSGATERIGETNLDRLETIAEAMLPASLSVRFAPLFAQWMDRYYMRKAKYEQGDADLKKDQLNALEQVLEQCGFPGVCELAELSPQPYGVGRCLSILTGDQHEQSIIPSLVNDDGWRLNFVYGYVGQQFESEGWSWFDRQLERCESATARAWLLAMLPFRTDVWDRVDGQGNEVKRAYWSYVKHYGVEKSAEVVVRCATELLAVDRIAHAVDVLCFALHQKTILPCDSLLAPLESILKAPIELAKKQMEGVNSHDVGMLLSAVAEAGSIEDERLIPIEVNFLDMLGDHHFAEPAALFRKLAKEPQFFVEVISWFSRSANEDTNNNTTSLADQDIDHRRAHARLGHELLHKWRLLPGSDGTGEVDEKTLSAWIESVRTISEPLGCREQCDYYLGELIACAPSDPDGSWPIRTVRKVAEAFATERLGAGIYFGVRNSRGVVCRGEGGMQERELAEKYKNLAEHIRLDSPFFASILDQLRDSYLGEGREWDGREEWER